MPCIKIACVSIITFMLHTIIIIESTDSISRDGPDSLSIYVIHYKIEKSQSMYRFKSSNCHYRNLRVEYYQYT